MIAVLCGQYPNFYEYNLKQNWQIASRGVFGGKVKKGVGGMHSILMKNDPRQKPEGSLAVLPADIFKKPPGGAVQSLERSETLYRTTIQ